MLSSFLAIALLQSVVIRDVTIIDGPESTARHHRTVTVSNGRITRIDSGPVTPPAGVRIVEGSGKYLLAGFVDTHAHVAFGPVTLGSKNGTPEMRLTYDHTASLEALRTLLAFGVTTVRNPAGPAEHALAIRDSLEQGRLVGPRVRTAAEAIELLPSPGLARQARTPEEVRAEVARQADMGVDYVKLYAGLSAPLMRAGVEEAHARGVKPIMHTVLTSWTDAANAGIHGIVHVVPGSPQLIPAAQRPAYLATITGTQFMATWFKFADLESSEIQEMTAALVRNHTWLDLTLVTFDYMFRGDQPSVTANPDLQYAPPAMVRNWEKTQLTMGWTPADFAAAAALWPRVEAFVRHLYKAGVRMTVGTDALNPWVAPGISFHRELELLVHAGIPASAVLRMATMNGAESMGLSDKLGSVEPGKLADLVLLDADPLANISNTQRVALVIQSGRVHMPAELLPKRAGAGSGAR